MAKAAAAAEKIIYRLRRSNPGGWQVGQLIHVVGATPAILKEFEEQNYGRPERYYGPLEGEDVAELNLSPAMDFTPKPIVDLSAADIQRIFGLNEEQIPMAIAHLGMPTGRTVFDTHGLLGDVIGTRRLWRSNEISEWESHLRAAFPNALPATRH
jgi:hypothetical protein